MKGPSPGQWLRLATVSRVEGSPLECVTVLRPRMHPGARRCLLEASVSRDLQPFWSGRVETGRQLRTSAFLHPALDPPGQRVSPAPKIDSGCASVPLPFNAVTGGVRRPLPLLRFAMQFPAQAKPPNTLACQKDPYSSD